MALSRNTILIIAISLIIVLAAAFAAYNLMPSTTTPSTSITTSTSTTLTTVSTTTTLTSTSTTTTAMTTTQTATTTSTATVTTTTTSTSYGRVLLRLATTTSFDATGLLTALKTNFEKQNPNINLTWVAVGTGQAIEIAMRGDADFVIVHSPPYEENFINDGYGIHGVRIAYNDYVIVGPVSDPAGVNSTTTAVDAFKKIAEAGMQGKTTFASRADKSGTNTKELEIWKKAGINASGQAWYLETGQGMAQTLRLINNLQGYTLTDRATWYTLISELNLKLHFEGDPTLLNIYRVFLINPAKYPNLHHVEAEKFVLFMVSPETQAFIGNYTKGGQKLFNPLFGKLSQVGIQDPYEDQEVAYWKSKLGK